MHPAQTSLERRLGDAVLEQRIQPDLNHFTAATFEEAALFVGECKWSVNPVGVVVLEGLKLVGLEEVMGEG